MAVGIKKDVPKNLSNRPQEKAAQPGHGNQAHHPGSGFGHAR
jgi:hypothetical protein